MNELIIISILVSLVFTEITGLVPGGIIIPFYFVLYIDEPVKIIATVIMSILCVYIIKLLSRFTILYGRRKFAMYIIVGVLLKILLTYVYFGNSYAFYNVSMTIGYVVPGILGREIERQGILKTLSALTISTLIIRLIQIIAL